MPSGMSPAQLEESQDLKESKPNKALKKRLERRVTSARWTLVWLDIPLAACQDTA